ncbi:MAG: type II toxin-antitoxin system PemK/MazF family toxin [Solirubrobacteraceae bacterium]
MASTEPHRGEVWLVSLGASRHGEPGKHRPAVVVSSDRLSAGMAADLIVVVPLSSSSSPSALRPEIVDIKGIDRPSRAICRAVRGVARPRLLGHLGTVEPGKLAEIEGALQLILGLTA